MDSYLEIKKIFEGEADKENAEAMSKYMRNKFEFYGLPTPKRKELSKDFLTDDYVCLLLLNNCTKYMALYVDLCGTIFLHFKYFVFLSKLELIGKLRNMRSL